jgi:hypothetical protein
MAHDDKGRVYIDNIYDPRVGVSDYGTLDQITQMGHLVYKPEDYSKQANFGFPREYLREAEDSYVDISALWENILIIKNYKEELIKRGVLKQEEGVTIDGKSAQEKEEAVLEIKSILAQEIQLKKEIEDLKKEIQILRDESEKNKQMKNASAKENKEEGKKVELTREQLEAEVRNAIAGLVSHPPKNTTITILAPAIIKEKGPNGFTLNSRFAVEKKVPILGKMGANVSLSVELGISGDNLVIKSQNIKADKFEGQVRAAIEDKISEVIPGIEKFLSDKYGSGKKIQSVSIEGGSLSVIFEK